MQLVRNLRQPECDSLLPRANLRFDTTGSRGDVVHGFARQSGVASECSGASPQTNDGSDTTAFRHREGSQTHSFVPIEPRGLGCLTGQVYRNARNHTMLRTSARGGMSPLRNLESRTIAV